VDCRFPGMPQAEKLPAISAAPWGRNLGSNRALVAASKSAASASSLASLHGRPTNDRPTGSPKNCAAGTVTLG